jgi:chlorite dismutase
MDGTGYAATLLNKTSATNRTNSKTDETARLAYIYAGADLTDWIMVQKMESLVLIQYAFSNLWEMLLIIAEADEHHLPVA